MRIVIQRVSEAKVIIEEKVRGEIGRGLLVFLGIEHEDTYEDCRWLAEKLMALRIFGDEDGKMQHAIRDVGGKILVVSQFTLHASTKKGNRPSFIRAARPEVAIPLYNFFVDTLRKSEIGVETGEFGADMQVPLINDGPVTIIIDSKFRE